MASLLRERIAGHDQAPSDEGHCDGSSSEERRGICYVAVAPYKEGDHDQLRAHKSCHAPSAGGAMEQACADRAVLGEGVVGEKNGVPKD